MSKLKYELLELESDEVKAIEYRAMLDLFVSLCMSSPESSARAVLAQFKFLTEGREYE